MKITLADALKIADKAWEADSDGKLSGVTRADIWQLIEAIKERDKEIKFALEEAVTALYFQDSADYEKSLWAVVDAIRTVPEDEEDAYEFISKIYEELNPVYFEMHPTGVREDVGKE